MDTCGPSLLLALLCTGCTSVLGEWDDEALCPSGELTTTVIPHPRLLRGHADDGRPSTRTLRASGLDLPALRHVAPAGDGLAIQVFGADAVREIAARCAVALPPDDEAYYLITAGDRALIAAATPRGRARAAALLAELWTDTLPTVLVADWPGQPLRGVLEGFYGPAWSPAERTALLDPLWRARLNTLVWAPKAELLSRVFWRAAWSDELLVHLRDLAAEARTREIELCAELSPGGGILYADPAERALVVDKLSALADLGVGCLAVGFDDISRELRPEDRAAFPGGLGEAHAALIAEVSAALRARHPAVRLGLVPTDYSTEAMEAHPEYTRAVADRLPREVFLGWTGRQIIAPRIEGADVDAVTALWGRPPLVGDNYPVTDGSRSAGRLQLGPVVGREPSAVTRAEGWIANALPLPRASMIPLATIAELLWSPEAYQPEDAWDRALRQAARAAGPDAHAALVLLAQHARSSALDPAEAVEGARLGAAWQADAAQRAALDAYLGQLAAIEAALAPLGPLANELAPWSAQLAAYGRAGLELTALTDAHDRGAPRDDARLGALRSEADRLRAHPIRIGGTVLDDLLRQGLERL